MRLKLAELRLSKILIFGIKSLFLLSLVEIGESAINHQGFKP